MLKIVKAPMAPESSFPGRPAKDELKDDGISIVHELWARSCEIS
jgi:hypothetical protein